MLRLGAWLYASHPVTVLGTLAQIFLFLWFFFSVGFERKKCVFKGLVYLNLRSGILFCPWVFWCILDERANLSKLRSYLRKIMRLRLSASLSFLFPLPPDWWHWCTHRRNRCYWSSALEWEKNLLVEFPPYPSCLLSVVLSQTCVPQGKEIPCHVTALTCNTRNWNISLLFS